MDITTLDKLPAEVQDAIRSGAARIACPRCGGGSTREACLSILQGKPNDAMQVRAACWRASCGWRVGVLRDGSTLVTQPIKAAKVWTHEHFPLRGSPLGESVSVSYGIPAWVYEGRWFKTREPHELLMEIRDPYGNARGHVSRNKLPDGRKAVYTYKATSKAWLDWWVRSNSPVVLVEDSISAARAHLCGMTAVALLGTQMNLDKANEILMASRYFCPGAPVYLALDADAFAKSLRILQQYEHVLPPGITPVYLEQDIKDMKNDNDIRALFGLPPV